MALTVSDFEPIGPREISREKGAAGVFQEQRAMKEDDAPMHRFHAIARFPPPMARAEAPGQKSHVETWGATCNRGVDEQRLLSGRPLEIPPVRPHVFA
jgi:hypothetical protein